jgi:hypothetical protein
MHEDSLALRLIMLRSTTALALAASLVALPARADKIANPSATFEGLDKITGRIISFDVAVGETVQFGSLQLTPRVCYSRPPTEAANSTAFIEVNEVTLSDEYRRIFTGWVFASSPGLHAIEHPIYDIWLTDCKGGKDVIVEAKEEVAPAEPELKGSLNKPAEGEVDHRSGGRQQRPYRAAARARSARSGAGRSSDAQLLLDLRRRRRGIGRSAAGDRAAAQQQRPIEPVSAPI